MHSQTNLSLSILEAILDQLPIGAIVVDNQGIVRRFNRHEEQLAGRKRSETIGKSFFSDIAPCTSDIHLGQRFREGIAAQNLDLDIEFSFPYPYNRVARDVRIRASTVQANPEALHIVLIEDITTQKSLEKDNQRMLASLQKMLHRVHGPAGGKGMSMPVQAQALKEPTSIPSCVLFADLSSFTRTAANIPPSELFARLDKRVRIAVDAVHRHGGRVDKILGDGVIAYFPDTLAGHRSLYDALRASRDIVRTFISQEDRDLPFRVGLTYGDIVIGPVGRPEFGLQAMVGSPVALAQNLAQTARPNEVLMVDSFRDRVADAVHTTELMGVVVPGLPHSNAAFSMDRLELP